MKKRCAHQLSTLKGDRSYCLTKEPIIAATEFESVSEIKYNKFERVKYVELKLTLESYQTFKGLMERFPETNLALVVGNRVTGILENQNNINSRIVPIRGSLNSTEIDWIYNKLKKGKP